MPGITPEWSRKNRGVEIKKSKKRALLVGIRQEVGKQCLYALLNTDNYIQIHLVVDEPIELEHERLRVWSAEMMPENWPGDVFEVDDVFCCLGGESYYGGIQHDPLPKSITYRLTQRAWQSGVHQFCMLSSVLADSNSVLYYRQERRDLEKLVTNTDFWAVHLFRPAGLLEDKHWGERLIHRLGARLGELTKGVANKYRPIPSDVVARSMVSAAQRLKAGVHIYSAEYLQEQAAQISSTLKKRHG